MPVTSPRRQVGPTLLALALLLVTAAACSKSTTPDSGAGAGTTLATIGTTPVATGVGSKAAPPCTVEVLQPPADAKYPGITLADVVCSPSAAIATLTGPGAPGGDGVAFFVTVDGAWKLVADGPAADADALRPTNVGTTLVQSWRDKRTPPPPTTAKPVGGNQSGPNAGKICRQVDDAVVCETTTTTSTTTTTRPPTTTTTTTAPPPTEPPVSETPVTEAP